MQSQTDQNRERENKDRIDFYYKVGGKVLIRKDGILCNRKVVMTVIHGTL